MRQLWIITLLFSVLWPTTIVANEKETLINSAKSAVLLEADTGEVLYDEEGDQRLPPASMTKLMSMLLIVEAIDDGELKLNETIQISENAESMGGSQIYLEAFEEMKVEELLKAVAVASANDATVALAEAVAVTEQAFIDQMNEKANDLGLENTQFQNTTGLPAEDHYSSAHDMAVIAQALLEHEMITEYTQIYEDYIREGSDDEFWLVNTNRLVKFYQGLDGLKTGYTDEAEYCLTATAKRGNMRLISVVMGAKTPQKRNADTTALLDHAFSQYHVDHLYSSEESVYNYNHIKSSQNPIHLTPKRDVTLLLNKGETADDIETDVTLNKARWPVSQGDEVGKIEVKKDGEVINETPLIVKDDIKSSSVWSLWGRMLKQLNH